MDKQQVILDFLKRIDAICEVGLTYNKDPFALENYEQLQQELRAVKRAVFALSDDDLFARPFYAEERYPTPRVGVRVLIMNEAQELLFVQEADSGKWSVPGGWVDVATTPTEAAVSEVVQETGYTVTIERLLAVVDRRLYLQAPVLFDIHQYMFAATITGGMAKVSHETLDSGWFAFDNLPELSSKNTYAELTRAYEVYINGTDPYID